MPKFTLPKYFNSFLPLLVIYMVFVAPFAEPELFGDEARHLVYAENLSNGYYTSSENPILRNGPGYPLVITLFSLFDAPHLLYKLFNAFLMFFAMLLFYKSISQFIQPRTGLILTYVLGLYPPFLRWMPLIHSESLAVFLACGFLYYFLKPSYQTNNRATDWLLPGFFLGMLVLTKILFAYVAIALGLLYVAYFLISKSKKSKRAVFVLSFALLLCTPYLAYTYSCTGKMFYLGTGGGEILYWRSSPFEDEYGDWVSTDVVLGKTDHKYYDTKKLIENHGDFIKEIQQYPHVKRDSIFKVKAVENIKNYPLKYLQNTGASASRLFLNFPESYSAQGMRDLFYVIPNMFLLVFLVIAGFLSLIRRYTIPFEVWFLSCVALVYMGGLILLNGIARHLVPAVVLLFYFVTFVLNDAISIKRVKST